jgi:hypothetical protein
VSSIRYADLFESDLREISVPAGTESMTMREAALAWAEGGFFVLPISLGTKHAGSILGKGWPEKTSRDPLRIESWFAYDTVGLAIHVGRSGAVAFDVDRPSAVPYMLREWLAAGIAPFQSTRTGDDLRGHYLFASLEGRAYGNSSGRLGSEWGEVRGRNGIIVVAPTTHAKADEGGRYHWERTGPVPVLPYDLDQRLPQARAQGVGAVDLQDVEDFLKAHNGSLVPDLLFDRLQTMRSWIAQNRSRHDSARSTLTWVLREAMAGLYGAETAVVEVLNQFALAKPPEEWTSANEFTDMVRWAIAQVQQTPSEELAVIREAAVTAADPAIQTWARGA